MACEHQIHFTYDIDILFIFNRSQKDRGVPDRKLQYAKQFPTFIFES
jgi:hypothetical protein